MSSRRQVCCRCGCALRLSLALASEGALEEVCQTCYLAGTLVALLREGPLQPETAAAACAALEELIQFVTEERQAALRRAGSGQ